MTANARWERDVAALDHNGPARRSGLVTLRAMPRKGHLESQDWEWAGDNDQSDVPPCVWREVDPRGRCGLWGLRASEIVADDIKRLPAARFTNS